MMFTKKFSIRTVWTFVALMCVSLSIGADTGQRSVVVLGDSLSAGYGMSARESWVSLLAEKLKAEHSHISVVNAAISGDTTRGGKSRIGRLLKRFGGGDILILELGGNDGLRGVGLSETRKNLSTIITKSKQAGLQVLLIGMQLPPNLGPAYTKAFAQVFPTLAEDHSLPLVPFLLENVALNPRLMQADGIHPTAEAQSIMLDNVWPRLSPLL